MNSAGGIIEKELEKINLKECQNKRILVMGRIEHACLIAEWFQVRGMEVEAILDNDRKKQGLKAGGLPILAPEQVLQPFQKEIFIVVYSPKYWEDMCIQLAGYGYKEGRHVQVLARPGLYKNIRLVKEGVRLYRRLQREYGKDVLIFLTNCPLGDFYLLGLYFHQYCKENRINNYVVAGMSRGIEKLSSVFHIKAVKHLTGEESDALIRAWIFLGDRNIKLKPLTIWQGGFRFNSCQTRQTESFSFLETFTKMIYSLDKPEAHYPYWSGNKERVKAVFRQNRMQAAKTVILSPFSYSLQPLPSGFWIELARMLKGKGYSVAVNVGEEREYNFIPDTATLQMDFPEIMDAMELAGTVVGMRSGFFDITAQAKCRRIVLYPPSDSAKVEWNRTDIGFCSLKRMGLRGDAYEWEAGNIEEIYKKIRSVL